LIVARDSCLAGPIGGSISLKGGEDLLHAAGDQFCIIEGRNNHREFHQESAQVKAWRNQYPVLSTQYSVLYSSGKYTVIFSLPAATRQPSAAARLPWIRLSDASTSPVSWSRTMSPVEVGQYTLSPASNPRQPVARPLLPSSAFSHSGSPVAASRARRLCCKAMPVPVLITVLRKSLPLTTPRRCTTSMGICQMTCPVSGSRQRSRS